MKQKRAMKLSSRKLKRLISYILTLACVITCLFGISEKVYADENFASEYMQNVFNEENGLGSAKVNCIYQTRSGHMWIGTDGGLYRYNGSEFRAVNLWDTLKTDVYTVNDIYQDSLGRLFIATDNYGLFVYSDNVFTHFSDEYYNGLKCIKAIEETEDNVIYVATPSGLYFVDDANKTLSKVEGLDSYNIKALAATGTNVWGITEHSEIFSYNMANGLMLLDSTMYTNDEYSCIYANDNTVYIGTAGSDIVVYKGDNVKVLSSGKEGINAIYSDNDGKLFVLADNGIGYFGRGNEFISIDDLKIDRYFSGMIQDYEGNYWFTSLRKGILYLGFSKFVDFDQRYSLDKVTTNCIVEKGFYKYIGTEDGLLILDSQNKKVVNELTDMLKGLSIRDIMLDSKGNLWISTFRRYGVVKYTADNEIKTFGRSAKLSTNLVNCAIELPDGNIAVGTEEGIGIIDSNDEVIKNYTSKQGLTYPSIISLFADADGTIYAGSDGGGLYIISGDKITSYTVSDGLTSDTVNVISKGENGIYIGTDNGLCLYNEAIRQISNVDFSNNIYDIICREEGIYIIGSKGVLFTTEQELLSTNDLAERYWSKSDGIAESITANEKSFFDKNGILYICCDPGICTLDTRNVPKNEMAPKLVVSEVDIDGTVYSFDSLNGILTIPSDAQKISISFGVLSYSNRENLYVEYLLDGFDKEPVRISGNDYMQAVYTNLEGGNYEFTISAVNGDGTPSVDTLRLSMYKESKVLDNKRLRGLLIASLILIIFLIVYIALRYKKAASGKEKELEELSKEHEVELKKSTAKTDYLANISNEIKLPINAIIRLAEKILKDENNSPEEQDDLTTIVKSGNDIIDKVDNIILLAKLESGRVTATNSTYSITTLVCDLSDKVINDLTDRPIKFFVEIGENIPDILSGDYAKIKDILTILLQNAEKYTKEGSIILSVDSYTFSDDGDKDVAIVFSVSDTGIGIKEERLEHIFEVYDISEGKNKGQNGINLAIAKKLTEIMGGELSVESTYGAGSLFTLQIEQKRPDSNVFTTEENVQLISKEEAERMWTPDLKALLVDDNEVARTVALSVLGQLEMRVDTATSGVSAIDMVMNNNYDIVFMDMTMPVMNGTDAMREIRDLDGEEYAKLPIIAMSEDAVYEERNAVIESGFTDMIIKPMDIRNLAATIAAYVSPEKIKQKTNNMLQYIKESRYKDGLTKLQETLDVPKVLDKIGGSIEVYNKILYTFYNTNLNEEEALPGMIRNDIRSFRIRIHNIKTGSINIGATELSQIAGRIESAINIGNREYAEDHINSLIKELKVVMEALYFYLEFVENQKGVSDQEFAVKAAMGINKKEEVKAESIVTAETKDISEVVEAAKNLDSAEPAGKVIDITALVSIQTLIIDENYDKVKPIYNELSKGDYVSEDKEFLEVLGEMIETENYEECLDILDTYLSLHKGRAF